MIQYTMHTRKRWYGIGRCFFKRTKSISALIELNFIENNFRRTSNAELTFYNDECVHVLQTYFIVIAARLVYGGSYRSVGLNCLCISIGNVGFNNQSVIRTGIRIWCIRHIVCLVHFSFNRKPAVGIINRIGGKI